MKWDFFEVYKKWYAMPDRESNLETIGWKTKTIPLYNGWLRFQIIIKKWNKTHISFLEVNICLLYNTVIITETSLNANKNFVPIKNFCSS